MRTLAHTGKRAINCPLINIQGVGSMCECWPTTAVFTHIYLVSLSFTLPPLLPLDATHFLLTLFWTWFRILLHSLHPPSPQENEQNTTNWKGSIVLRTCQAAVFFVFFYQQGAVFTPKSEHFINADISKWHHWTSWFQTDLLFISMIHDRSWNLLIQNIASFQSETKRFLKITHTGPLLNVLMRRDAFFTTGGWKSTRASQKSQTVESTLKGLFGPGEFCFFFSNIWPEA